MKIENNIYNRIKPIANKKFAGEWASPKKYQFTNFACTAKRTDRLATANNQAVNSNDYTVITNNLNVTASSHTVIASNLPVKVTDLFVINNE